MEESAIFASWAVSATIWMLKRESATVHFQCVLTPDEQGRNVLKLGDCMWVSVSKLHAF